MLLCPDDDGGVVVVMMMVTIVMTMVMRMLIISGTLCPDGKNLAKLIVNDEDLTKTTFY